MIGVSLINCLMHVNDLVLLAPSSMGLSMLLQKNKTQYYIQQCQRHAMSFYCKKFKNIHCHGLVNVNIEGIFITSDLSDNDNIVDNTRTPVHAQGNA